MCKTCHITFTMALKCGLLNEYLVIVMEIRMNKLVILYSKNKQKIKKALILSFFDSLGFSNSGFFLNAELMLGSKMQKAYFY